MTSEEKNIMGIQTLTCPKYVYENNSEDIDKFSVYCEGKEANKKPSFNFIFKYDNKYNQLIFYDMKNVDTSKNHTSDFLPFFFKIINMNIGSFLEETHKYYNQNKAGLSSDKIKDHFLISIKNPSLKLKKILISIKSEKSDHQLITFTTTSNEDVTSTKSAWFFGNNKYYSNEIWEKKKYNRTLINVILKCNGANKISISKKPKSN